MTAALSVYRVPAMLTHEEADSIAQRILGNIEPAPGESYDDYYKRMDAARRKFSEANPNWRNDE